MYSIIRLYQQTNRVEAIRQAGGRRNIIDNETLDLIIMLLEANPLIKLREIKEKVREIWPTKIRFS